MNVKIKNKKQNVMKETKQKQNVIRRPSSYEEL